MASTPEATPAHEKRKASPTLPGGTPTKRQKASRIEAAKEKAAVAPQRPRKGRRIRSDEQLELIRIREKIGLSQAQFATALGVKRDRIVNIENGRVLYIPDEVMSGARELLHDPERLERVERLNKKNMASLVDEWMSRLGLKTGGHKPHDQIAADLLLVHSNTISRWRKGEARPDPEALLQMDRLVSMLEEALDPKRIEEARKRIEETP